MATHLVFNTDALVRNPQDRGFYEKFHLFTKLTTCQMIGYRLLRFVNCTHRLVNLTITDCKENSHVITQLAPNHGILMFAPKSEHVWTAIDACNFTNHLLQQCYHMQTEETYKIIFGVPTLKTLTSLSIGERFKLNPEQINKLPLPQIIQSDILSNMIPIPESSNASYRPVNCLKCRKKLPKILHFNPYVVMNSEGPMVRDVITSLDEYVSLSDVMFCMMGGFLGKKPHELFQEIDSMQ